VDTSDGVRASTAVAPPTADASVPTAVIAIWIVARKISGDSLSCMAVAAPPTCASRSCASRLIRAETRAISEPAKKPFARIPTAIRTTSIQRLSNPHLPHQ
jgi:hypothetical protein